MKTSLQEKLDILKDLNFKTYDIALATVNTFDAKRHDVNSIHFVTYELIKRFSNLVKSTNFYIDDLKKDSSYEMQIGLLLRPALLDILSFEYIIDDFIKHLIETESFDWTLLTQKTEQYLADNIIHYVKESDRFLNDSYIKDYQHKNIHNRFEKICLDIFKKDIFLETNKYKFPSASSLFDTVKKSLILKKYAPVYYLYLHYSKYEHFGLLTKIMSNEKINSLEDITFRLVQSYSFINKVIIDSFTLLQLKTTEMSELGKVYDAMITDFNSNQFA